MKKKLSALFGVLFLSLSLSADENDLPDDGLFDDQVSELHQTIAAAHEAFDAEKAKIEAQFRKDFAKALKLAETGEVLLLDFEMVKEPGEGAGVISYEDVPKLKSPELDEPAVFLIKPYGSFSRVLKRKAITGEALKSLRKAVSELVKPEKPGSGAFCHFPIHGIRLGDENGHVIFETSVCYHCGNYFFSYPDQFRKASWHGFHHQGLAELLMKEMPIPQAETDRFQAKYGRKKK